MIMLTRLDGTNFVLNDEHIERLEETPTTVVTLVQGNCYLVQESAAEVVDLVARFQATVLRHADGLAVEPAARAARPTHLSLTPDPDGA